MSSFTRSGFLRLVRPASNALGRRAPTTIQASVLVSTNSSGITIPSIGFRRLSSSPVLNQSPEALQAAELRTTQIPIAEESTSTTANSNEVSPAEQGDAVNVESIMSKYQEAKASSSLTQSDYESFLKTLSGENSFKECYSIWKDMKEAGVSITSNCYAYVFQSGRKTLKISEIRALFGRPLPRRAEQSETEPTTQATSSYFFSQISEVKQMMDQDGVEFEQWFWDDVSSWLSTINQGGLLINIALALEERGISPSVHFYNKMLYTLPRCGFADRADLLFSRMLLNKVTDLQSYVIRLGSLVFMARYDEADKLFIELCKTYEPNEIAYNTIIHGYLRANQVEKALKVFEAMKQSESARPSHVTANTFLSYFYDSGELGYAKEILEYFKDTIGFPKNSAEKGHLLKFFARYEPSKAAELLNSMIAHQTNFDIEVYNSLLAILVDRRIPAEWKRTLGSLPLDKTYPPKVDGLAEVCISLPYHIRHLVGRMEAYNIKPRSTTYDYLMKAILARKDFNALIKIYQDMLAKNVPAFSSHHNCYLSALIQMKAPEEQIQSFLSKMRIKRWPISSVNSRRLDEANITVPPGSFVYN